MYIKKKKKKKKKRIIETETEKKNDYEVLFRNVKGWR
jgi:hypothetical protein